MVILVLPKQIDARLFTHPIRVPRYGFKKIRPDHRSLRLIIIGLKKNVLIMNHPMIIYQNQIMGLFNEFPQRTTDFNLC